MSKNFELMQEALREPRVEAPVGQEDAKVVVIPTEAERAPRVAASRFDAFAQQECYKLVQRLFLGQTANQLRAVVFAGIDRGVGCSRICVEAARILAANTGGSVCLLDANFRAPALAGFLQVNGDRGLIESLQAEGGIRSFARQLAPSNLWLLASGTPQADSATLLNSDRLKMRMAELRQEFDYILIDAPALNLFGDGIALGRLADGVAVVLQADATRKESALTALQGLRDANIHVLGAVLNRRAFPIPEFVYRRL